MTDDSILSLMPLDTPDFMVGAWLSCMSWAIGKAEIVEEFRLESGLTWTPANSPLDEMIDTATGAGRQFIVAFILWANVSVWGPMEGD